MIKLMLRVNQTPSRLEKKLKYHFIYKTLTTPLKLYFDFNIIFFNIFTTKKNSSTLLYFYCHDVIIFYTQ